jgi:nucleotide-binding universal stress UspA family protein
MTDMRTPIARQRGRNAARTFNRVIAAVDPLREDVAPAALGLLLARLTSAPLVLAGAYPVEFRVDSISSEYTRTSRMDAERAMRRVGALVEQAPGARVPVTTMVTAADGPPARALHDLAERDRACLLVIGSSRRGQVGRVLPGAVTDRLLHGAPCPVAVAPAGFSLRDAADGPGLIGVAFTDSPDGHAALATARTLAAQAHGLVRVLTVAEPLNLTMTGMLDAVALRHLRCARDDAAERVLRRGLDAVPAGRSAGGEILSGDPADALAATSADLDLLVCGSRGYGPIRTLLLGGTSHALVRKASCPVLVVPPGSPVRDAGSRRTDAHAVTG